MKFFVLKNVITLLMTDIKKLRKLLGDTQKQFAERFGVAERTVQNWERDEATIPSTKLTQLRELAAKFPKEQFALLAVDSLGAGIGNKVGICSADLKLILDEMDSQRRELIKELNKKEKEIARRDAQIRKRDAQIDELISLLKAKL